MLKKFFLILVILLSDLLSGCGQMHPPNATSHYLVQSPAERQATLAGVRFWRIAGAFSIQQFGIKPEIANYTWQQFTPNSYRIQIVSALGLYRVEILYQMKSVTFWKNGLHVATAKTPEGLMQHTMGWSLPISELAYWIKGAPAPDRHANYFARYDQYGHLLLLQQNGWIIQYGSYKTNEHGVDLPQVITLVRPGLSAKIIVKQWHLLVYHHRVPEMMI